MRLKISHLLLRKTLIVKATIITGVFLLSGFFASLITGLQNPAMLVLTSLILSALIIGIMRGSITDGIIGVLIAALIFRYSIPTGTQSQIPASLVITVGVFVWWLIHSITVEKRLLIKSLEVSLPLLSFIIICVIAYLWSNLFRDPMVRTWSTWPVVQLGGLSVMVLLPILFLVSSNQTRDTRWVRWIVVILLTGGILSIAGSILQINTFSFLQVRPLFPTLVILLAISLAFFHTGLPVLVRGGLVLLAGAWFYDVFALQFRWLSSWVPALIGIGFVALVKSKRVFLIIFSILAVYTFISLTSLKTGIEQEWAGSSLTRFDAWARNWDVTREHLIFGMGPAGYAAYYMTYFPNDAMATHNNYLDILSQTGIFGLVAFIWFLAALGVRLWRFNTRVNGQGNFVEAYAKAAFGVFLGTVVAMAMGDWVLPFVYTQTIAGFDYASYTWILLGGAVAMSQVSGKENSINLSADKPTLTANIYQQSVGGTK